MEVDFSSPQSVIKARSSGSSVLTPTNVKSKTSSGTSYDSSSPQSVIKALSKDMYDNRNTFNSKVIYDKSLNQLKDYSLNLRNENNKRYDEISNIANKILRMNNKEFNSSLKNFYDYQMRNNYSLFDMANKYNDTAYQRLVKDLKAAGLNPMLAAFNPTPNRVSSVPYNTNVPAFKELTYNVPNSDSNNYMLSFFQLLSQLLSNASQEEIAKINKGFNFSNTSGLFGPLVSLLGLFI